MRRAFCDKALLLCLAAVLGARAWAGVPTITLSSGSGATGANVTLSVSLSSNGGTQPAGLQWDLLFTSTDLAPAGTAFYSTGPAASAAGKQASCNVISPADIRCLVVGLNSTVISDGVIATVTFQISPTTAHTSTQISFSGVVGTDTNSNSIDMTGIGSTVTITQSTSTPVLSSLSCSPASLTPPGSSSCSVTLSAAAKSSTSVALSSDNSYLTVPASVSIGAGSSSAGFTASASAAVSSSTTATVTASLSGNTRSFSIALNPASGSQPGVSSLVCTPGNPTGGTSSYCVVYLSATASSGGTAVTLTSSNSYASAPGVVVVAAGSSSASFTATTIAVTVQETTTISAISGSSTKSAVLTIQPVTLKLSSLSCSPSVVGSGGTSQCTVTLSAPAPAGGLTVGLSSNNSSVTVPVAVVISAGSNFATFTATAATVTATGTATLTAAWNGQVANYSLTASNQAVLSSLVCTPTAVTAGSSSSCSATLSKAAPSGGLSVSLSSTNPKVTVPAFILIPAGASAAGFMAAVAASAANNDTATISASVNSIVRTVVLTVSKAPPPGSTALVCTPATVQTPGTSSCQLTLASPAPSGGLTLTLNSSKPSLSVPTSVTVAAGLTTAVFTVTATPVTANVSATITVSPVNVSETLTLVPEGTTNLSVTSVSCAPTTLTGGGTSACQIALSGVAPSGGQGILLSSNSTQIAIPQVVSVAQGSATAPFSATSALIDHDESATITANLTTSSKQTALSLIAIKPLAMACSPKPQLSGSPVSCQITLNSSQASSISLAVASSNTHVSPPSLVSSVPGQAAITFQAATNYVVSNLTGTVSATYHGLTVQDSVTLTPAAPVLHTPALPTTLPGKALLFTVTATDPVGLPVQISVWGLPPNSSFNPNNGVFTWVPDSSQLGFHTVHFTATNSAQISSNQDVQVFVNSTTPVVLSLENAASYAKDGCSAGAAATLMGAGFVNSPPKAADSSPLPTQVNGLQVKANDQYLPVFYASAGQVNFQCPALAPGETFTLQVVSGTGSSAPLTVETAYATPGIFSIDGSGTGQGAILVANTGYLAMPQTNGIPSQPVKLGGSVSIYATGLGPVETPVPSGEPASLTKIDPVQAPVDVLIGGVSAKVEFAGLAPGYVGLYQVNVRVPDTVTAGNAIAVEIDVHQPDGTVVKSNNVTMAIAAN